MKADGTLPVRDRYRGTRYTWQVLCYTSTFVYYQISPANCCVYQSLPFPFHEPAAQLTAHESTVSNGCGGLIASSVIDPVRYIWKRPPGSEEQLYIWNFINQAVLGSTGYDQDQDYFLQYMLGNLLR